MKVEPSVTRTAPPLVIADLSQTNLADRIYEEVLRQHLHVKEMGPAEFYVDPPNLSIERSNGELGCEVRLTGVSYTRERSEQDFYNARAALQDIYAAVISVHLPLGMKMQLFVVIMIDQPIRDPDSSRTTLVEENAIWVEGEHNPYL